MDVRSLGVSRVRLAEGLGIAVAVNSDDGRTSDFYSAMDIKPSKTQ